MKGHADYHMHTYLCGHGSGTVEEYVLAGSEAGLDAVGFSEHIPMYWLPPGERDPGVAMGEEEWEGYVTSVLAARERYPEISVRLGVEADYIPGREADLERFLAPYPWDYVYGSVHFISGWGFDDPDHKHEYDEWDVDELYERYFGLMCEAAQTGMFDVMAHLDVIKKWGHRPARPPLELYDRVAQQLQQAGVVVEANTAGYRKPVGELYPGPELLQALVRHGVSFTLGSDAHSPGEVASGFREAVAELQSAGCRSVVRFEARNRVEVPLHLKSGAAL